MAENGNGVVKIGELERKLFMLLLQQICLTFELILRWLSPEDLKLPKGTRSNFYFRLNRLKQAGYVKKQTLQDHDVYLLDRKGIEEVSALNKRNLPLVNFTELETINHDITTAYVRHYFESHGATDWVSDREFRGCGQKLPQIPDGAFTMCGLTVFVEVELTRKSLERYEKIAAFYTRDKGPHRVLYLFREPSVVEPMIALTRHHPRLGFFPFDEDMSAPD